MKLANPTVLPSGILGERQGMLEAAAKGGAGLLVTKSVTLRPREGYRGPVLVPTPAGGIMNAMGLPNPGIEEFSRTYAARVGGRPVIPSIHASSPDELRQLAMAVDRLGPPAIEVNLSCPHAGGSRPDALVSQDPAETARAISAICTNTDVPIIAKLTPNVSDIVEIAAAALYAGASAIAAVNTFAAMDVDVNFERPVLGNLIGGLSGPAIRPLALRKVADIAVAMRTGCIDQAPIIASGGAASGEDLARFILVGATAVGMGSAVYERDAGVFAAASAELDAWMQAKGYRRLGDFRGKVIDWLATEKECADEPIGKAVERAAEAGKAAPRR